MPHFFGGHIFYIFLLRQFFLTIPKELDEAAIIDGANPLHTLLSTLGIVIGVAALVAILSLGDGMEAFARKQIERTTNYKVVGRDRADTVIPP